MTHVPDSRCPSGTNGTSLYEIVSLLLSTECARTSSSWVLALLAAGCYASERGIVRCRGSNIGLLRGWRVRGSHTVLDAAGSRPSCTDFHVVYFSKSLREIVKPDLVSRRPMLSSRLSAEWSLEYYYFKVKNCRTGHSARFNVRRSQDIRENTVRTEVTILYERVQISIG